MTKRSSQGGHVFMSLRRPIKRQHLIAAALVLAAALAVAGSGGASTILAKRDASPAASASAKTPVTIHLASCCAEAIMAPAIQAFEQKYPDITVKQEVIPFDQLNDVIQQRIGAKDTSIDVYFADQPRTAALAARGLLADLTTSYLPEAKSVLYPAALAASTYKGKLWSAPFWESSHVMIYNKTLLKKAGITPPSADPSKRWTWEQTLAAAKKAKAAGAPCGLMLQQVDRYYELEPLVVSAGGGTGLTGPDNLGVNITNPGWIKAMTFYSKLFSSGVAPRGVTAEQTQPLLNTGKCAFFVGTPDLPLTAAKTQKIGIAPEPRFAGGKAATPTDSFAFGLSPYSTQADAAMTFIKYVTLTNPGALAALKTVPTVSSNQAASKLFYATQLKGKPDLKGLAGIVTYELNHTAVHRPQSVGYIQFETIIGQAFADIRNGKNPKTVLAKAQVQIQAAFKRL